MIQLMDFLPSFLSELNHVRHSVIAFFFTQICCGPDVLQNKATKWGLKKLKLNLLPLRNVTILLEMASPEMNSMPEFDSF